MSTTEKEAAAAVKKMQEMIAKFPDADDYCGIREREWSRAEAQQWLHKIENGPDREKVPMAVLCHLMDCASGDEEQEVPVKFSERGSYICPRLHLTSCRTLFVFSLSLRSFACTVYTVVTLDVEFEVPEKDEPAATNRVYTLLCYVGQTTPLILRAFRSAQAALDCARAAQAARELDDYPLFHIVLNEVPLT